MSAPPKRRERAWRRALERSIPPAWRKLFQAIPGYCPIATATAECHFDAAKADFVVAFVETVCSHVEGRHGPYLLEPYEKAILGCLYGWQIDISDTLGQRTLRRYREVFILIARKNGKTMLAAALILFELFFGGEPGAKLFSMSGKKEQAGLVFDTCCAMLRYKPDFKRLCKINTSWKEIIRLDPETFDETNVKYRALPTDADTSHGLNPHVFINDELHAQHSPLMTSAMETGTGGRDQPIQFSITTQDYDRPNSICLTKYRYACDVRDGKVSDPTFLPVVFEARPGDDPGAKKTWSRANPKLYVISSLMRDMESAYRKALHDPVAMGEFKRVRLNLITATRTGLFETEQWDRCAAAIDPARLRSLPCWGGLDWALSSDIAAWVKLFRDEDARTGMVRYIVQPTFWVASQLSSRYPAATAETLRTWIADGLIEKSIGATCSYAQVKQRILADHAAYRLTEVAADPHNCAQMLEELQQEGLVCVQIQQSFAAMNEATQQVVKAVADGELVHDGNAVLRWMALNTEGRTDPKGNIMPSRSADRIQKIDGIVATIIAMARAMVKGSLGAGASVYDQRGVVIL